MKKIFVSLIILIIFILSIIYVLAFTKYGNGIISSYLENRVNAGQEKVKLKINNFRLTFSKLDFNAVINDDSYMNITGDLALFKKSVDLVYDIKINDLSTLKNLTNQEFKGSFFTNGILKGDSKEAIVHGFSNIASSETKYYINLIDFKANSIQLDLKNAKIEELLNLLNKPIYTKGLLTINANVRNIDVHNLDGLLTASITKGLLDNEVINKEFEQKISSSVNFKADINASLLGDKVDIKSELVSSLFDLFIEKTSIDLKNKGVDSDYKIDVKNLNRLEGIIGKKLNGEFSTNGRIKFQDSVVFVDGKSNIIDSDTFYKFEINNNIAQNISFKVENTKVEKLLNMLNEPIHATGDLSIRGDIKNSEIAKLDGNIESKINNGKIINEVVNAVFNQDLKDVITFNLESNSSLVPNQILSQIDFDTNIAKMKIQNAIYSLSDSTFNSDYLIDIASLEKIKDLTKVKLRGEAKILGKIYKSESDLFVDGKSNILGGDFNFNLQNSELKAKLINASIKELSYMLIQPEFFNSKADFTLDYDLLSKKGNLTGSLLNGHFLPNEFSKIINQLAKFDLTKEIYESVQINSNIEDKQLISNLIMKSKNTQIDIKDSFLDFEKNTIDAKLDTQIKSSNFSIKLQGEMNKPKISLDIKDLLKQEIDKKLEKNKDKINDKIDKVLGDKIEQEKAKELIKNFKSIF
ncbi:hypothetical protein [Arcobacter cloacae]|uniref:Uncharacterized protein n=1 Tax=Arcobacter cloacae TaxID=1054034 RepID=A0A6M8NPR4_9BACT|nr:hypothetical protein [Arcobacter cloacae]QKF90467.1 hypothetical protein ACLO_1986 [Arcobacter cloacae]RXI38256.1 hypothetical protein CP963_11545 [Arcobacter cloacae]